MSSPDPYRGFDDVASLCKYCGKRTHMNATLMCDACWSLDTVLRHVPAEARNSILADHGIMVVTDQLPPCPWSPPTDGETADG